MNRAAKLFNAIPELPLRERYLQLLLTNTVGNTFYAGENELLAATNFLHTEMAATDPGFMARALSFARQQGLMRLQPVIGLVHLSACAPELFGKVFDSVILTPGDLVDFFQILSSENRGQGGRMIKRRAAVFLNAISEYWALKYNGRGRGYTLSDLVRTIHPKPASAKQQHLFAWLLGKEPASSAILPQVAAFEELKRAVSDEQRVEIIRRGRLPWEIVTGCGKPSGVVWQALLQQMPALALLRNLNTLERHNVLNANRAYITSRFSDKEALRKSRVMPFQFCNAFTESREGWVRDLMREAVEISVSSLPTIAGRTAIFLDISGSMDGRFLNAGAIFAVALFKKTGGNAVFYAFDDQLEKPCLSLHDSILTQAAAFSARGNTDSGLPMRELLARREQVDNVIMITDEQHNTGMPFAHYLNQYRGQINPDVKPFIVNVAPYTAANASFGSNAYYIYGWNDTALKYISLISHGMPGLSEQIANTVL